MNKIRSLQHSDRNVNLTFIFSEDLMIKNKTIMYFIK